MEKRVAPAAVASGIAVATLVHPLTDTDKRDCLTCCWLCNSQQVTQLPMAVWLSAYSCSPKTQMLCYLNNRSTYRDVADLRRSLPVCEMLCELLVRLARASASPAPECSWRVYCKWPVAVINKTGLFKDTHEESRGGWHLENRACLYHTMAWGSDIALISARGSTQDSTALCRDACWILNTPMW